RSEAFRAAAINGGIGEAGGVIVGRPPLTGATPRPRAATGPRQLGPVETQGPCLPPPPVAGARRPGRPGQVAGPEVEVSLEAVPTPVQPIRKTGAHRRPAKLSI